MLTPISGYRSELRPYCGIGFWTCVDLARHVVLRSSCGGRQDQSGPLLLRQTNLLMFYQVAKCVVGIATSGDP